MTKDKTERKKWKSYISGIITSSFLSTNKNMEKYFRSPISDSTTKAIQENWIRILGIDYEIICLNLFKDNKPLGIALEGRNEISRDNQEVIQRHFLRAIMPNLCVGVTRKFLVKDELLEVNGLKITGLPTKDVIRSLKKVANYFQIVVARSRISNYDLASDYGGSEDNINSPISFYDVDEDESSRCGTLKSLTSNYSTTSRDFGSSVSFGGMIDGQHENIREYLRNIIGWRGPIVLEFRKQKEPLGLALEEISDPKTGHLIIVFKIIVSGMKAGKDGRLHAGDRLLQVNGKSIVGVPFRKVCQWMKSSNDGRLIICICKPHFESNNYDFSPSENVDNCFCNTLSNSDKLPKVNEETDENTVEIPAAPESLERHILIKRTVNRLGIFLDVYDDGKHGCRIKKISPGLVQEDGRLHEGDLITKINDSILRVDNKAELNNCLKNIIADTEDYRISYITAEDIALFKNRFIASANVNTSSDNENVTSPIYPDLNEESVNSSTDVRCDNIPKKKVEPPTLEFVTLNVVIKNDRQTGLGLVLSPSLRDPTALICITHIHEGSLSHQSKSLRINDDILMANGVSLENMSIVDAGNFLKSSMVTQDLLRFTVRRLVSSDDECVTESILVESLRKMYQFPDLYSFSMKKGLMGYGFSIIELDSGNGVIIEKIDQNSEAQKIKMLRCGDKFIMINKCCVHNSSKTSIMQIIKNSTKLDLIMERSKYREFLVNVTKDSSMSLGLNVGGGIDTKSPMPIIESLFPNRTSVFSEELYRGDYIYEVNGRSMYGYNHDQVIQILRSTKSENEFKILRPLPYNKRPIFDNIEVPDFPLEFLSKCRYSVSISKPIETIKTFGINFADVVIIDHNDDFKVLERYKIVLNIENNSLTENYAKEIKPFHYLLSINTVPVNSDILSEDLKDIIDSHNRIDMVLSTEIPYAFKEEIKDYDSPILLHKTIEILSSSDNSSIEEDINTNSCDNEIEKSVAEFHSSSQEIRNDSVELTNNGLLKESEPVNETDQTEDVSADAKSETEINVEKTEELLSVNNVEKLTDVAQSENFEQRTEDTDKSEKDEKPKDVEESEKPEEFSTKDVDQMNNTVELTDDFIDSRKPEEQTEDAEEDKVEKSEEESDKSEKEESLDSSTKCVDTLKTTEEPTDDSNESENTKEPAENITDKLENPEEPTIDGDKSAVTEEPINDSNKLDDISVESTEKIDEANDFSSNDKKQETVSDGTEIISELGINIEYITVEKLPNMELGFHVFGGLSDNPNGEVLPVFVVGVEKNSCNWPPGHDAPLLKNGFQLIELNGTALSSLKLSKIEHLIQTAENELKFRVLNLK